MTAARFGGGEFVFAANAGMPVQTHAATTQATSFLLTVS